MIGIGAGPEPGNDSLSHLLFIDSNPSFTGGSDNNPLIYGEFDNDLIRISGEFEVTASLMNPSSRELKENFERVDAANVLDKIASLKIERWRYKHRPDEKHIGAVAQDFHKAFGLGSTARHIGTIDADGVMMLAIQELNRENKNLRRELQELQAIVESIKRQNDQLYKDLQNISDNE